MPSLSTIIGQVELHKLTLPKFQRGFVWNRTQIRELFWSLYHGYPIGSFLVWETASDTFLLDGQQRITSLFGVIRGELPKFSDGDLDSFLNLYFNVETEEFEFYGITKMQHNPRWISVTEAMQEGTKTLKPLTNDPKYDQFVDRVNRFTLMKGRDFHVETISGSDWTLDEVVRIFNQINSGGTKLTQGDLAMAKISVYWPQAREVMREHLNIWKNQGYQFKHDWLLRCMNALLTDHSQFDELSKHGFTATDLQNALNQVKEYVDFALTLISSRLGLVDTSVFRSPNSIPAIIRFLHNSPTFPESRQLDRLLYWYVCTLIWGRYSTSVESRMRQDLLAVVENKDPVDALIERLRQTRGHLRVEPQDFDVAEARSRIFPLLYLLSRVNDVPDFCSGLKLSKANLGKLGMLQRHHIFPKAYLRKHGITNRYETNALANFTWLTMPCNTKIGPTPPEEYFPHYEAMHPGVLASHWIPMDEQLWRIENYHEFLAVRRELLAAAANEFLDKLLHGDMPEGETIPISHNQFESPRPVSVASDEEEATLQAAMDWMESKGLPRGEYGFELVTADGELLTTLDLAWPRGIQEGMTRQAALLINESEETRNIAEDYDFKCFTSLAGLQLYVRDEILGEREPV